tara:strand:- start:820 stop:3054 length:2235 start_codon:yes stop_codon:yes gene_type:complete
MFKYLILFLFSFLLSFNLSSKPINISGLSKLSYDDIQSITSINIYDNNSNINNINILIKELSLSDLIYDISYEELSEKFQISITESDLIENIFINNNIWIKDDALIQNLKSKTNYFMSQNNIQDDIRIIKNIYKSKGFQDLSVIAKVERYSQDRINLIYEIKENDQQKINIIKFVGNNFFSNNYLNSTINSQSIRFYNIFKTGSNLNFSMFEYDKNQILSSYKDEGFLNVKVSYVLEKSSFNNNVLYFYIDEGDRFLINDFILDIKDNFIKNILNKDIDDFKKKLEKNNFVYNKKLIEDYIELFNQNLISNNINNQIIKFDVSDNLDSINLLFYVEKIDPVIISKISITGNSITKDRTIRSKISIEPGQYLNKYTLDKSIKNLKRFPYIKDVKQSTNIIDQLAEITLDIDEEKKTGNILVAGTLNSDTGVGLTFGIEDKNVFGSGNSIRSNFTVNSEDLKFDLNYVQYPILNPNLTNTYTIFNQDNDYTSSFGYKASIKGIGYFINFNQNDKLSYGAGFNYEAFKGHSAVNKSSAAINDNIGNFDNYNLNLSVKYDSSDDYFYPTNGTINKLDFSISPKDISDNSYYKVSISNKNYRQLKKSTNYFFLNNNYGFAKSSNGKLKTINAFGLGGLNFKGFDYKGIGPNDGSIYLGGNEYFTTTLGYGSSFIFDDKDNINVKFFLTAGSIWNSDYDTSSDADLRTSLGTSFDFITPIGPISFSYAIPINKKDIDKSRPFNFTIGTSF